MGDGSIVSQATPPPPPRGARRSVLARGKPTHFAKHWRDIGGVTPLERPGSTAIGMLGLAFVAHLRKKVRSGKKGPCMLYWPMWMEGG